MSVTNIHDIIDADLDLIRYLFHEEGCDTSVVYDIYLMGNISISSLNNNPYYPSEVKNQEIAILELNDQTSYGIVMEIENHELTKMIFNFTKPPLPLMVNEIQSNQEVVQSLVFEEWKNTFSFV